MNWLMILLIGAVLAWAFAREGGPAGVGRDAWDYLGLDAMGFIVLGLASWILALLATTVMPPWASIVLGSMILLLGLAWSGNIATRRIGGHGTRTAAAAGTAPAAPAAEEGQRLYARAYLASFLWLPTGIFLIMSPWYPQAMLLWSLTLVVLSSFLIYALSSAAKLQWFPLSFLRGWIAVEVGVTFFLLRLAAVKNPEVLYLGLFAILLWVLIWLIARDSIPEAVRTQWAVTGLKFLWVGLVALGLYIGYKSLKPMHRKELDRIAGGGVSRLANSFKANVPEGIARVIYTPRGAGEFRIQGMKAAELVANWRRYGIPDEARLNLLSKVSGTQAQKEAIAQLEMIVWVKSSYGWPQEESLEDLIAALEQGDSGARSNPYTEERLAQEDARHHERMASARVRQNRAIERTLASDFALTEAQITNEGFGVKPRRDHPTLDDRTEADSAARKYRSAAAGFHSNIGAPTLESRGMLNPRKAVERTGGYDPLSSSSPPYPR